MTDLSNMKLFVLALFVSVASAEPLARRRFVRASPSAVHGSDSDSDAVILRSDSVVKSDGFNYAYETGNGIAAEATGVLQKVDAENEAIVTRGQFKYDSPDGTITVTYVADQNGFQPQGSHLPVAPPIPDAILRGLKYIEDHPAPLVTKKL